ncbi:uncharacterized protein LOC135346144 [Halichondria panicea]|uniref:uncharacterized protein LOC135346144 n=1 Tax=Halichondria panicea TaxID=6063 RepID=UPI00312BCB12
MKLNYSGCLLLVMLVSIGAVYAQSGNSTASASGSGSGSGDDDNCESLQCSHGCNETSVGPMCYCPGGYELGDNEQTCQECRGGYWGVGCSMMCECSSGGAGNPCNNVNGACICNSCWTGTSCETSVGSGCFLEFLQLANKSGEILQKRYGGAYFPTPHVDTIQGLIVDDLLELNTAAIVANPELTIVSRSDVGQGDLAKLKFTVDYTVDRPAAEAGLARLADKVKLGGLRVTLIQQLFTNTAEVTINAGTNN